MQVAHQPRANFGIDDCCCASAEVDRRKTKRLIHGHQKIAGAQDSKFVAESVVKGLAQHDADIFHGVMLINVQISFCFELQVKCSVASEKFQHVVQKTNAGRDFVSPVAIDGQGYLDISFCG